MFNKKRIFVFIVFLLLLFFLMTFGGGRGQNAAIATRTVTFTDGYNMKDIAKYEVEVGKDAVVPEVPVHSGYIFTGWYDFENQSVKVTNFTKILEDLHVLAKYSRDANGNGIPDENDDYFTVTFMDSIDKVAIKSQRVLTGMGATAPNAPVHEGFVFTGWDKPYNKVVSDLIINALYDSNVSEYSSYKVEYYTIHNDETSLYDTKSLNAKTADTVSAEIITIEGYTYDSSNPLNVISGFVSPDNSLVLKVYYNANEYTVIVDPSCEGDKCNQIEEPHEYGDEFELPKLSNSYTLTYDEADEIGEGLDPEVVPATLIGYCKSMETCENPIPAGTKVTVKEDVTYYAVWSEEDVTLKTGSGYETQEKIYSFAKWENGGKQYEAGATFTLTKNETVTALYTSVPKQYTVIIEPNCAEGEDCTPTDDPENPVPTDPVDYGTTIKLPNIERAYRLTFIENENVKNQLGYEDYVSTLQGYCKNVATCEKTDDTFYNVGDEVTVEEDVTYYAIYDKPVLTAEFGNGANYSTTTENGYFTKWTEEEAETSAEVTSPLTMIADKTIYAQYDKKAKYTITWKNDDGSVLETDTEVEVGTTPSYDGETPTKAADAQYTYTFNTWTPEVTEVTGDAEYTATYTNTTNTYTVTWKNEDGSVLETDTGVAYGTTPTYDGETPTKAADAQYTYIFNTWSPEVTSVTGDAEYTATYTNTTNTYTVTWKNEDGSVLETDTGVAYGTTPSYDGETPTKAADAQYTYTFNTWSPEVATVTGDAEYTATYNKTAIEYTITYVLNGGTNPDDAKTTYTAEDLPYTLPTPTKEGNSFDGWFDNEELTGDAITTIPANESGNKTFYAKWSVESYKVTYSYTGDVPTGAPTVPAEQTYEYGATVPAAQVPTLGGYVFSGWEGEVTTMPSHDVTVTGSWRERNQDVEIVTTKEVSYDDGDKLSYGDTITFTITVKNNGTDPSDPVTLIDSALAGSPVTLVSTNTTPTSVNTSGDILDGTAGFTVESVPAGGEVVIVITVKVEGEDALPGTPVESQTTYVVNGESKTEEEKWSDLIESEVSFIQKTPNTKGYNIVVLLDQSGSMGYQDKNCLYTDSDGYCRDSLWNLIESTKFINAKAATSAFIDMIFPSATDNTNNSVVSVYRFGSNPKGNQNNFYATHVGNDATNQSTGTSLKSSINALGDHPYKSGTPYGTAFSSAINKINNLKSNGNDNIVIFLTDGSPSTSNAYEDNLDTLVSMGVKVYSIGFDVNDSQFNLLQSISSQTGVNAYRASNDVDELTQTFAFIKAAFEEPNEEWTEEGTAEMAETLLIDASHPLQIFLNDSTTPYKSCTTDPTTTNNDCTGLIIKKDGKYDVDASKFAAGSKIKVVYYVPAGSKTRRLMKSSVNLNSKDFVDVSTVEDLEAGFHIETEEVPVEEIINVEEETSNNEVESTIVEPETNEEIITDEVINNETIIPETNEVETPVEEPTEVVETPEVSEEPTEEVPETITELPVEVEPIGEVVSVEPIVEETNSTEVVEPEESEEE